MRRFARSPLWVSALLIAAAADPAGADPLFESNDVLSIRISGPLRDLVRERSRKPEDRPATLTYRDPDGSERTLEVGLRPRGHSRRDRAVCTFPPLRVNVRKKAVSGTLFHGQDKLKLVSHCRRSERHDRYVYKEYLAYRLQNELTGASFRVRPLDIEWVDEGRGRRPERRFGFFIEHEDRLAARLGMEAVEPVRIHPRRLAVEHTSLMELFQFMIGNTDFSFLAGPEGGNCCHNASLLQDEAGRYWPMPYDFDITGFVDPPYAVVDQTLSIASVRRRLYRGFCRDERVLLESVQRVREARPALLRVLRQESALDARSRAAAIEYIDGFYAIVNDPTALARRLLGDCRGR